MYLERAHLAFLTTLVVLVYLVKPKLLALSHPLPPKAGKNCTLSRALDKMACLSDPVPGAQMNSEGIKICKLFFKVILMIEGGFTDYFYLHFEKNWDKPS